MEKAVKEQKRQGRSGGESLWIRLTVPGVDKRGSEGEQGFPTGTGEG